MNLCILIGNLTDDPTIRKNPKGIAVCKFKIATSNGKNKQGEDRPPDYHNITVWGRNQEDDGLAKDCMDHLQKGSRVAVRGKITENKWESPEGTPRHRVEVICDVVEFLTPKKENGNE